MNGRWGATVLGGAGGGYEYRSQFFDLFTQVRYPTLHDNSSFDEQVEPIANLVDLLKGAVNLADELRS